MKLAFSCPKCRKQLHADAALAGRAGRCRACGHRIIVPAAAPPSRGGPRADADQLPDWRTAVASQLVATPGRRGPSSPGAAARPAADAAGGYSLRPVTPEAVPAISPPGWAGAALGDPVDPPSDDEGDFTATAAPVARAQPLKTPSQLLLGYRWLFGRLVQVTTWISETSYTVSFIVIILAMAGGMVGRHALAQWGTLAVVVLNLVGLAGDVASLVTLSFRRSPAQGALFLVPPFTLYYLWSDWERYRDVAGRMRIPLVTLACVVAAYLFVPWLRGGTAEEGAIAAAVKRTIGAVEQDFGRPQGETEEFLDKARSWLREPALPGQAGPPGPRGTEDPRPAGGP